ncbi:MAG: class I SAM-dependent methyltransferase [Dehalococcoidales bacterium]|nr:class I SAM-dependent methyltransferase [Dehalococcoidales bacterium]
MKMLGFEKLLVNNPWSKKRGVELAKKLMEFVELDKRTDFLEIGGGNGEVAKYIARYYIGDITATDIDEKQITVARKGTGSVSNLSFQVADAKDLPFDDETFDVVISFGVLHHIEGWQEALSEIKRVLKPKGYLVYAEVIYPEGISEMDKVSRFSFGLESIDIDEIKSLLKKYEFTEIHSLLEKTLVCQNYEAVYRKAD